jgi:apolipoprotein N-acyltransferase
MTSEVMVPRRTGRHTRGMKRKTLLPLLVLVPFTVFTAFVVIDEGLLGLIETHKTGWGQQVFADLVIAITLFLVWMVPDARRHGLPVWPFVLATLLLGSIGALSYLVVRSLVSPRGLARAD